MQSDMSMLVDPQVPLDTILLHELNHRIGNVFQLATTALELAARRAEGNPTEPVLRQAAWQLQGHATVHRLLDVIVAPELVDGCAFLAALCAAMQQALPAARFVRIEVEAGTVLMPAAQGRLIGLLVHELILNAVKHAFGPDGGRIVVALAEEDGQVRCSVADDGLGLREADPVRRGLGMTLIEHLARHTGATCSWRIGRDGTKATITTEREASADPGPQPGPAPGRVLGVLRRLKSRRSA